MLHIAGYKFIQLLDLVSLRDYFFECCKAEDLKGTILLSEEGININLSGLEANISAFKAVLRQRNDFADITFRESCTPTQPYKRLKIKFKKEIITLRQPDVAPLYTRAPSVTPEELKQWLDESRDVLLVDTRNDYEIRFGTFAGALNLRINNFGEFPDAINDLDKEKPVVMFCTGGIRCEKAAIYMLNNGHEKVYQLDGGILNYFAKVGGNHYDGECYVFDERTALDCHLSSIGTKQCVKCQGPISLSEQQMKTYIANLCAQCGVQNPNCF